MFESGKKRNAAKKAYEIAYALFRISAKISESSVKDALESRAIELLTATNTEAFDRAAKEIVAIEALTKFSIDLNIMSIANGDVLLREIAALNEIVIERLDKSDDIDVSKFFSSPSAIPAKAGTQGPYPVVPALRESSMQAPAGTRNGTVSVGPSFSVNPAKAGIQDSFRSVVPAQVGTKISSSLENSSNPAISLKSGNRQIAILDRIRQSGNCKLRDIQEILPDCSERTIRYDLEELIERNLVERIGAGGPAVSYRIRQSSIVPAQAETLG
jgi:DNA-binding HxlR family transcriptional regulator